MNRISEIGNLLKKIYRIYSNEIIDYLSDKGFSDLRPSFLEILTFIADNPGPSIKVIGNSCGLKKQTMTSHLNELEKRGYIIRKTSESDRREQHIFFTDYGERFKLYLNEALSALEKNCAESVGSVELERLELQLKNFHHKIHKFYSNQLL